MSDKPRSDKLPLMSVDLDDVVSTLFQGTRINTDRQWKVSLMPGMGVEVERIGGRVRVVPFTKVKCFEFPKAG